MKVFIASDLRATVCDGRIYLVGQHFYILKRYYDAYGPCVLCSRVVNEHNKENLIEATDYIEKIIEVKSLKESLHQKFLKKIESSIMEADLVVARLHSIIGMRVLAYAEKKKKKCFAELMGDAWDGYWNHGITGKMIAPFAYLMTKRTVWKADYALYVTSEFLQRRYPCKNKGIAASNVQLMEVVDDMLKVRKDRIDNCTLNSIVLMTTAAVDVRYKGQEYVIKAIPMLNKAGIHVRYLLVGGGDQTYLKRITEKCGVSDQVEFIGRRPLEEVFKLLDTVDIYVQPSLQEGLPRSVIEAMSRGCPVIGAKTAGIPELISPECVVKRKSAKDIACKIMQILSREKLMELSERNYEESKQYSNSVLNERRERYFAKIKNEITNNM